MSGNERERRIVGILMELDGLTTEEGLGLLDECRGILAQADGD